MKVLDLYEALKGEFPLERTIIDLRDNPPSVDAEALAKVGFGGMLVDRPTDDAAMLVLSNLAHDEVVAPGDVIRLREKGQVSVLYRRRANANALFVTERCNSFCLMCSQPPRDENDDWRVDEIIELVPLIDKNLPHLGITGGEPTLLGSQLAKIIECVKENLPQTLLHILTNGRRFADRSVVDMMEVGRGRARWAIPLYGDTAPRHDYIVQANGAFEETLNGIYNLAERRHTIEIRVVLHAQTVDRLLPLMDFIWRTMPFVDHVALMGLEPMGFAKMNRDLLWIDPLDYANTLEEAAWYLHDRGIPVSIYNVPFCVLPRSVWPLAKQSISDWKNVFSDECVSCSVRETCCGFFMSASREWRSRGISTIQ
jgi:His-Xaa-Ser system radical SAM maturase HxsC